MISNNWSQLAFEIVETITCKVRVLTRQQLAHGWRNVTPEQLEATIEQPPRAIEFMGLNGKRCRLRIGKVSIRDAKDAKRFIERLLAARKLNHSPDQETLTWLEGVDVKIQHRIAKCGLCKARGVVPTLEELMAIFVDAKKLEIAPSSVKRIEDSMGRLRAFFDCSIRVNQITPAMAKDWRTSLLKKGLAEATVRNHTRNTKTLFNYAIEREILRKNPFRSLPSASIAAEKDRYITPEETEQLIEAAKCWNWKALIGLMRYSGLRCPKEALSVCWSDIDWNRRTLVVLHAKNGKPRKLPIRPELFSILEKMIVGSPHNSTEPIINLSRNNLHRKMGTIIEKAGVEPWADLFQHLRRCCRTQWLNEGFPSHAVSRWMGHGQKVGDDHYTILTDDVFDRATGLGKTGAKSGAADQRIGLQIAATDNPTITVSAEKNRELPKYTWQNAVFVSAPPAGLEPATNGLTVRQQSIKSKGICCLGCGSAANTQQRFCEDEDLLSIVQKWNNLADSIKSAIVVLVSSAPN